MAKNQPNKTVETSASVSDFIASISDPKRKADFGQLVKIFEENSGYEPKMWGPAIVGFGTYHYKYDSGREGDASLVALSPRVQAFTLYLGTTYDQRDALMEKFGKYTQKGGCTYVKKMEDIDVEVLAQMVQSSTRYYEAKYQ